MGCGCRKKGTQAAPRVISQPAPPPKPPTIRRPQSLAAFRRSAK